MDLYHDLAVVPFNLSYQFVDVCKRIIKVNKQYLRSISIALAIISARDL